MIRFAKSFSFFALVFLASGCQVKTTIEDLNKTRKVIPPNSNPNSIKISNSAAELHGSGVTLEYSVGFKDRTLEGSNVDATISISTNRPQ